MACPDSERRCGADVSCLDTETSGTTKPKSKYGSHQTLPHQRFPKSSKKQPQPEYELETIPLDEIFAIFTLFKDVNDMRDYIKGVWNDYHNGRLDAMSAAVTTDTAFTLLKQNSDEVLDSLPGVGDYPGIMMIMVDYLQVPRGSAVAEQDWFCFGAVSLLNSFSEVLDPARLPVLKPGHFGAYDPSRDRSRLSEQEKQREDLIVLMELLPEFTKLSRVNLEVPGEDLLTAGLRKMMDASSIDGLPMYAIFATQMLLDIHHVLRQDVSRPFNQLQATGKRVVATLDDYFRYSRSRRISNWPPQNDEFFRQISGLAKDWALEDRVGKCFHKGVQDVKAPPYHLLKNHPVLAGLLTFRLNLLLHDAGITLCNAWGSVLYPLHLYNAVRQSADLTEQWDDAEYVVSVHSPSRIFVGGPPTDPQEHYKRILFAVGGSASNFARNRRRGGQPVIIESKKGPRGLKTTSPVRDIFETGYLYGRSTDPKEFSRKMVTQKQFTSMQLLTAVREGVASEELHLLFDYFTLHQRGYKLLRDLQTHLQGDMTKYFGSNWLENESELPYVVGYIFEVVRGSDQAADNLGLENTGSRMLADAAAVLGRMLQSEGGMTLVAKAKAFSDAVVFAYHSGTLG